MTTRTTTLGMLFATTTAVVWGGQLVVGKSALETVDALPLSTVRYAIAAGLWLVVLGAVEGLGALRLGGRGWRLFWLGSLGFAGFNLFAYTGLAHARPESASLIVALGPLLTALVLWHRTRVRPTPATSCSSGSRSPGSRSSSAAATPARSCTGRSGGASARPRRGPQLRALQARRGRVPRALAPPLHGAHGCARVAVARRRNPRRGRRGPRAASVRASSRRSGRRSPT